MSKLITQITGIARSENGIAAFLAIAMMTLMTIIGMVAMRTANDEVTLAGNERSEMRTFYAAESGLEKATAKIIETYQDTGEPPVTMPSGSETINNTKVEYKAVDDGPAGFDPLTVGALGGLNAVVKRFSMSATGTDQVEGAATTLNERFEAALIPLFQYGVFYDGDMEINTGPGMTFDRIHSNGDMYIGNANTLNVQNFMTSGSRILHEVHPASGLALGTGQVNVTDVDGTPVGMNSGGSFLDNSNPNWYDSSMARWGGRVQDTGHGFEKLDIPLLGGGTNWDMIDDANGGSNPDSYENRASIKIINQSVLQDVGGGVWVDQTATAVAEGWFSVVNNSFTDFREAEDVDVVEIDMALFSASALYPGDGLLYVSDDHPSRDFPALHLKNGATLAGPLTVACENPVYIEGDYNTVGKVPAAIISDAATFLSTNWDTNKLLPAVNDRDAANMSVNAALVTGHVPSDGGNYSGGVENLPRFLEDWGGRTFNFMGSLTSIWESQQANSQFNNSYFVDPIRNWSFDPDLYSPLNLPPASPVARSFRTFGWQHETVGYARDEFAK